MSEPQFRVPVLLLALLTGAAPQAEPVSFDGLVWAEGRRPDLAGKVVVVRWWTNGCHFCTDSVDALRALEKTAALVSVYHPKPPRDVTPEQVTDWARAAGIPGTLAIDRDWAVLKRWMAKTKFDYTSLTFLLDGRGRIREVHPGGTLTAKEADDLGRRIEALRAEE